jgi:hypothetical protein
MLSYAVCCVHCSVFRVVRCAVIECYVLCVPSVRAVLSHILCCHMQCRSNVLYCRWLCTLLGAVCAVCLHVRCVLHECMCGVGTAPAYAHYENTALIERIHRGTKHTVHSTAHHSTQHTVYSTHNTASSTQHPAPSTQHTLPSTQHPAPSTQHPAPSTQHPAPSTAPAVSLNVSNFFCSAPSLLTASKRAQD